MKKVTLLATMVLALAMFASAQQMIDFTQLNPAATPQTIWTGYHGFAWTGIDYVSVPLYENWLATQAPPLDQADGMLTGPEAQVALVGGPLCYKKHGGATITDICRGTLTVVGPNFYFRPAYVVASEGWSGDGQQFVTVIAYLNGRQIGSQRYNLGVNAQKFQLVLPDAWGAVTQLAFYPSPGGSVVLYVVGMK